MGIDNPYKKAKEAGDGKAVAEAPQEQKRPVSRRKAAQAAGRDSGKKEVIVNGSRTRMTDGEIREGKAKARSIDENADMLKLMGDENVQYVREHLGMDLSDASIYTKKVLEDIYYGRVTDPLPLSVVPFVYDGASRTNVEMPRVDFIASVQINWPKDKVLSEKNPLFVKTIPHLQMCEQADGESMEVAAPVSPEGRKDEAVVFTDEEKAVLEGIGISAQRLDGRRYNALDGETMQAIKAGEPFVYDGTLKLDERYVNNRYSSVNISGIATLVREDGRLKAVVEPLKTMDEIRSEEKAEGLVLDIVNAAHVGNSLEIDIYRRDAAGKKMIDDHGMPVLNDAAWDLVKYGRAMQPMDGYMHDVWEEGAFRIKKNSYQVSVRNGSLVATRLRNEEGETPKVQAFLEDGKLKRGKELFYEFASDRDRDDYVHGLGGVVKDVRIKDYKTGKCTVYDAFAVADNQKGGHAYFFSPEQSAQLIARRAEKDRVLKESEEKKARRSALLKPKRQGFSPKH